MKKLNSLVRAYLKDIEPLLEPVFETEQKWLPEGKGQVRLASMKVPNPEHSYSFAAAQAGHLASHKAAERAFCDDAIFGRAKQGAGYWGTFDGVMRSIAGQSSKIAKDRVRIDHDAAIRALADYRRSFDSRTLDFQATCRLLSTSMTVKSLPLPNGVTLYRLNQAEAGERQPAVDVAVSNRGDMRLLYHRIEMRSSLTLRVDRDTENVFFKVRNQARRQHTVSMYRRTRSGLRSSQSSTCFPPC